MPIYEEADRSIYSFINQVMAEYFSVLMTLEPPLEIEILFATDPKTGVGIKHNGHAVAAKIKLLKPEDRAAERRDDPGVPDSRLVIDKDRWLSLSDRQRTALIHHELSHLVPKRNKDKTFKRDDFGRVQLKLKLDNWMLTGFLETAQIFGDDALEVQSLKVVQALIKVKRGLPFGDAAAAAAAEETKAAAANPKKTKVATAKDAAAAKPKLATESSPEPAATEQPAAGKVA